MVSAPVSIQAAASIIIADSKTPGDIAKPVNVLDLFSIFRPPIPGHLTFSASKISNLTTSFA
jgi:hypothetical protein